MSDEKMREGFEVWAKSEQGLDMFRLPHGGYRSFATHQAWAAWQASRKAVCVELPTPCSPGDFVTDADVLTLDQVLEALDKAGASYK